MKLPLLLDTNAYADLHRSGKWLRTIHSSSKVYLPIIVLGELRFGFINGNQASKNEFQLREFLSKPSAGTLALDSETTFHYASIHLHLRQKAVKIPQNDLWIAALALQHGLWLCTSDSHFDHIPELLRALP